MALEAPECRSPCGDFMAFDAIGRSTQSLVRPGKRSRRDLCDRARIQTDLERKRYGPGERPNSISQVTAIPEFRKDSQGMTYGELSHPTGP